MNVFTRWTRSRLSTTGVPFSRERVTSALQPECTRKPTAACFMEASAAEEWEALIYIVPREKCSPFHALNPLTQAARLPPLPAQFHARVPHHPAGRINLREFPAGPPGS